MNKTSPHSRVTGVNRSVNPAGKAPKIKCLLKLRGDAKSLTGLGQNVRGQLGRFVRNVRKMNPSFLMLAILGTFLFPSDLLAHDGNLLKDEITAVEKLFTGGYMRLGLLAVCGFAAIYGIVKQSGWIFASGVLGCVFAYFMKDWVLKTFSMVV